MPYILIKLNQMQILIITLIKTFSICKNIKIGLMKTVIYHAMNHKTFNI